MKQTAVEWLKEIYDSCNTYEKFISNIDWEQAEAMEKEQIMDAREDGHLSTYAEYGSTPKCYLDGGHEEYYNETFKSE